MAQVLFLAGSSTNKNIVTDYGAVADGVTDSTDAFTDFRTWARTQGTSHLTLTVPAGSYVFSGINPFAGIKRLIVSGYGATFPSCRFTANCGYLQTAGHSARVETVTEGEGTATCITPGDAANFAVGDWCSLAALEWQGQGGYPPNFHYHQFVQITGISGAVISFTPVAVDDYSADFPATSNYPSGTTYDSGGPAALFKMGGTNGDPADSWDTEVEVYGVTVVNTIGSPGNQVYSPGKSIRYVDMTFTDCEPIPNINKLFSATNITVTDAATEVDKDCEWVEYFDSHLKRLDIQSSSITQLVLDGVQFDDGLAGTPRRLLITGTSDVPSLQCGPSGYGATEEIVINAPAVVSALSSVDSNRATYASFTQSGGDLTYTPGTITFGVPGTLLALATSTRLSVYGSVVSDVTASARQPILHTDFADPLPTLPVTYGSTSYVKQHPVASITVSAGVTGCDQIVALAGATPGLPLFSTIDFIDDWITPSIFDVRGQLVSLLIDVLTPYTGAQSTANLHFGGVFDNLPVRLAGGTAGTFAPIVNTKIAGQRLITPIAVTGGQSGDTLGAAPGLIWFVNFGGGISPKITGSFGADTAGQLPSVRISIILDQAP